MRVQPLSLLLLCSTYFYSVSFSLQEAAAHNLVPDSDFVGADNTAKYNWHKTHITSDVGASPINYGYLSTATLSVDEKNEIYIPGCPERTSNGDGLRYSKTGDISVVHYDSSGIIRAYTFSRAKHRHYAGVSGTIGTLSVSQTAYRYDEAGSFDVSFNNGWMDIINFKQTKRVTVDAYFISSKTENGMREELGVAIENLGTLRNIENIYVSNATVFTAYDETRNGTTETNKTGTNMVDYMFGGVIYNAGNINGTISGIIRDSKAEKKYYLRTAKETMGFNGDTSNYAEFGAIANSGYINTINKLIAQNNTSYNYGYAHAAGGGIVNAETGQINTIENSTFDANAALSINFKAYGSVYNKGSFFLYTFYPRPA